MDKKIITALVLLGLFITFSVGVLVNESVEEPNRVCDSERLMKGYTGETYCYNYYPIKDTNKYRLERVEE